MEQLNLSEVRKELNRIKTESKNYWKTLILGALENYMEVGKVYNITMQNIENIVDNMINNDEVIILIDKEISNELFRFEVDKNEIYNAIMIRMKNNLEETKTRIIENKDRNKLDSLAYELSTKLQIINDIENEVIEIEDYLQDLSNLKNPLETMYNKFKGMIVEEDRIITTDTIYDILNNILKKY